MRFRVLLTAVLLIGLFGLSNADGQTSSIGARQRRAQAENPPKKQPREKVRTERNATYDRHSWIATSPVPPKTYRVNDLITIVVRQRVKYKADADLETKSEYDIQSQLDAFLKPMQGGIGSASFRRGKPNIEYKLDQELTKSGDTTRKDQFTTRLTAKIIDIKPNGQLVLEGKSVLAVNDEISQITVTGTCRKEDVTPDNTVLSTQISDLRVVVKNEGALRAASSRGWLAKLLDKLLPF